MHEREELELIKKVKSGDRAAFRELYEEYKDRVMNFLFQMVHSRDLAEEIAQEAFVQAYSNIHRFNREKARFSTWLFTIARYLAINEFRRAGKRKSVSLETAVSEDGKLTLADILKKEDADIEGILQQEEASKQIRAVMEELPDNYREVITLCLIEGLTYEEAAKVIGCEKGAIAMRLARAKKHFINLIKEKKKSGK